MHHFVSAHHPRRDRDDASMRSMRRGCRPEGVVGAVGAEFRRLGLSHWVQVPGAAAALDGPRRWTLSYMAAGVVGGGKARP